MAIRRGLDHGLRTDHAAAAGLVFDDDRAAQRGAQLLGQQAGGDVHTTTGTEGNDDGDVA
ncbi:hypothetical protein FQZ97_1105100 [compost metagenome]